MPDIRLCLRRLLKSEDGLETIEYAIIAAIALLLYGSGWGGSLRNMFLDASSKSTSITL
jgi:Flp pilus assembly pilin Flp